MPGQRHQGVLASSPTRRAGSCVEEFDPRSKVPVDEQALVAVYDKYGVVELVESGEVSRVPGPA